MSSTVNNVGGFLRTKFKLEPRDLRKKNKQKVQITVKLDININNVYEN